MCIIWLRKSVSKSANTKFVTMIRFCHHIFNTFSEVLVGKLVTTGLILTSDISCSCLLLGAKVKKLMIIMTTEGTSYDMLGFLLEK